MRRAAAGRAPGVPVQRRCSAAPDIVAALDRLDADGRGIDRADDGSWIMNEVPPPIETVRAAAESLGPLVAPDSVRAVEAAVRAALSSEDEPGRAWRDKRAAARAPLEPRAVRRAKRDADLRIAQNTRSDGQLSADVVRRLRATVHSPPPPTAALADLRARSSAKAVAREVQIEVYDGSTLITGTDFDVVREDALVEAKRADGWKRDQPLSADDWALGRVYRHGVLQVTALHDSRALLVPRFSDPDAMLQRMRRCRNLVWLLGAKSEATLVNAARTAAAQLEIHLRTTTGDPQWRVWIET